MHFCHCIEYQLLQLQSLVILTQILVTHRQVVDTHDIIVKPDNDAIENIKAVVLKRPNCKDVEQYR